MKMTRTIVVLVLAWVVMARGEVTPEELIQAVNQMSPEQVQEFQQKLEAKLWKPVPEGFFSRMAVDLGVSYSSLDTVNLTSLSLSGGRMDVDRVGGLDLGLLWRMFGDRFRVGLRVVGWGATDSNLGEAGYSRADVAGGNLSFAANYQWVRSESWLLWTEIAPGAGSVAIETVNTPTGQATTLRSFDGSFGQVDVQTGASLRFNPVLTLFLSGGYRFAESVNLEEGGRTSDVKFDASGFSGRLGLGMNF